MNNYDKFAEKFNQTRQYNWPEFKYFDKYIKDDMHVLDIGCGNGRLYKYLNKWKNIKYKGIDKSKKLIQIAKQNNSNTDFEVLDMKDINKIKNKYDIIFFIASFHHLENDKDRLSVLLSAKNLLTKNGYIIMLNWYLYQLRFIKYHIKNILRLDFSKNLHIPWRDGNRKIIGNRIYHAFSIKSMARLIYKTELKIIENKILNNKNIFTIIQNDR